MVGGCEPRVTWGELVSPWGATSPYPCEPTAYELLWASASPYTQVCHRAEAFGGVAYSPGIHLEARFLSENLLKSGD